MAKRIKWRKCHQCDSYTKKRFKVENKSGTARLCQFCYESYRMMQAAGARGLGNER